MNLFHDITALRNACSYSVPNILFTIWAEYKVVLWDARAQFWQDTSVVWMRKLLWWSDYNEKLSKWLQMHLIKFTTSSSVCNIFFSNIPLLFVLISYSDNKTISVCSCKNMTYLCVCSLLTRIWFQCHDHILEEPGPPESGVKEFNLPWGCFNDFFLKKKKKKKEKKRIRSHITEWVWWINLF